MNIKKNALYIALGTALSLSASASPQPISNGIAYMNYSGLFTMLNQSGRAIANTSQPYYNDMTWGYGLRTQISGTLELNMNTGAGTVTVNPFDFDSGGPLAITDFNLQAIGDGAGGTGGLVLGNMQFSWDGNNTTSQVVLDASGLLYELFNNNPISSGDVFDASNCAISYACATPASDGIKKGSYPIGPVPISTTSFNTTGQTGFGTTLDQLNLVGLGIDDIGGSPIDNGIFSGYSTNFDFTSITMSFGPQPPHVPVPAAVWLFGSGLLGLAGVARRRKTAVG